tara:strand:+ start:3253 stop:4545 length:1293 start_codon:yes stop_codon:yes gene_type:complete
MSWMIKVEELSKIYRLGLVGSATIQDDLKRAWYKWRGKEDPFLTIGEENKRDSKGGDYVWALKDINFEVKKGEVLGIIGRNGAGKSTLLKLLSKVTKPTKGSIKTKGRIASLLEVGTGFHPELTGRENIFLNGAILGMKKNEIKAKFDEIVDFSGCERYIDTPVKRYSSGMYVRLAFAVAAHLEPEILVVDEVLAVGDAEFQKKAIGKMKDVSEGEGRTVLFVSHNMASISKLCTKALVLDSGKIIYNGDTEKSIETYLRGGSFNLPSIDLSSFKGILKRSGPQELYNISKIEIQNHLKNPSTELIFGKSFSLIIEFNVKKNVENTEIGISFSNSLGTNFGGHVSNWNGYKTKFNKGLKKVRVTLPFMYLTANSYYLTIWIKDFNDSIDDQLSNVIEFNVLDGYLNGNKTNLAGYKSLNLTFPSEWTEIK